VTITIPSAPHWITPDQVQFVKLDEEPLHSILENCNRLYAYHSPALVNIGFTGDEGGSATYVFPMPASADGLEYTALLGYYNDAAATVTANLFEQNAASTGSWGSAVMTKATAHGAAGHQWVSMSGTISAGYGFGQLTLSTSAGNVQAQSLVIFPKVITSISVAAKASGFVPYDDAALNDSAGAIHREYINRVWSNVRSVMRDRRQAVFAYVDNAVSTHQRYNHTDGAAQVVGFAGAHLPGQSGATITFRGRAQKVSGAGTAKLVLAELGGQRAEVDCDDTDNTATLTLRSDQPLLQLSLECTGAASVNIRYATADWRPGD